VCGFWRWSLVAPAAWQGALRREGQAGPVIAIAVAGWSSLAMTAKVIMQIEGPPAPRITHSHGDGVRRRPIRGSKQIETPVQRG
jgi:hypothetical protein